MPYLGKSPSQGVRTRFQFTPNAGTTSISGADANGLTLSFTDGNYVDVYLNGVMLKAGVDYNTNTANTIAGLSATVASDVVDIVVYDTFSLFGGTLEGNVKVNNGTFNVTGAGDFDSTLNVDGVVTANSGVVVGNIIIAGTEIDLSSGNLTIDVANDIILDSGDGDIQLKDTGSTFLNIYESSDHAYLYNPRSNADIIFQGNGVSEALRLDMSASGAATFNAGATFGGDVQATGVYVGTTNTSYDFYNNGTSYLNGATTIDDNLTVAGNITTSVDNTVIAPYGSFVGFVKKSGTAGSISYASSQSLIFSQSDASSLSDPSSETYSEKMRIDTSGRVMIGTTTEGSANYADNLTIADSAHGGITIRTGTSNQGAIYFSDDTSGTGEYIGYTIYDHSDNSLRFGTSAEERMRISSSGHLFIAKTSSALATVGVELINDGRIFGMTDGQQVLGLNRKSSNGTIVNLYKDESSVGTISVSGTSTSYNTSSDYRLKENVVTDWDATSRLKQLKPSRFNFKIDKDTTVDGFLAHEVSSIVPEAVTGTKDEVDENGDAVMQGIDQSKLVPLLVKTIQELEARIAKLEGA